MARLASFARELRVHVDAALSPEARSRLIADAARQAIGEASDHNARVLGRAPPHDTYVDGRKGAALEGVNPDHGRITAVFEIRNEVVDTVWEMLVRHSPVLTGKYRAAHRLFADGVELDAPDPARQAVEWTIVAGVPYAGKIERGWSAQAPDGVYEAAAVLAKARYGNLATIRFTYIATTDEPARQPAIIIRML